MRKQIKIPPTAYGARCYPGGRVIEVSAKHQTWTDYAVKCIDAYPSLVAALKEAIATTPPDSAFLESRVALLRELGEL